MPGIVTSRTRRLYSRPPGPPYTLNRDDPQARGLLAWWPLGEANPAGYIDYASNSRVWVPGASPGVGGGPDGGYAPSFTGTESLKLTAPVVTAYPFTVLVWGNPSSVSGSKTIWSEADEGTTNNIWQMYLSNASFIASVSASGSENIATAGNTGVANVWNSFVYRANSATSREAILNANIASKGTATLNRTPTGLDNTVLGMLQTSAAATNFFAGRLGHACIWGVPLSDDEVWATYDPETRWNLYYPLGRRSYSFAPPPADFPFRRRQPAEEAPVSDLTPYQPRAVNRLAALSGGGFLTPALAQAVRSTSAADSSSIGNTYGSNTAANGFLAAVLSVSDENSLTVTPPTGWSQADVADNGTQCKTYVFYRWNAPSVSSATTLTFTFGATAFSATLHLLEFTNVDNTADPRDQHTPATGSGTTPTTGTTGNTSQAVELVLAGLGTSAAGTFSLPSSPYLIGGQAGEGVEGLNSSAALWRTTSTTGTQSASATHSSGGSNATVIATFRAAGGAPVTPDSPTGGRRRQAPFPAADEAPFYQPQRKLASQAALIAQQAPPGRQPAQVAFGLFVPPVFYEPPRARLAALVVPPPVADNPPTRQTVYPYHAPPTYDDVWWWPQRRTWPVPVEPPPPAVDTPPLKPRPVPYEPPPDWLEVPEVWTPRRTRYPVPTALFRGVVLQRGLYRIINTFVLESQAGRYRIANAIDGYVTWVGVGAYPDLTATPDVYSAALPYAVPLVPPGAGTQDYYLVTRKRDRFGLVSQNQRAKVLTLDSAGNQVLPALPVPQSVHAVPRSGSSANVRAVYPTAKTDEYPATLWRFWAGASPPNPLLDPPLATAAVSGSSISLDLTGLAAGTIYVAVALYRAADAAQSPAATTTVVVPSAPDEPGNVHGGLETN